MTVILFKKEIIWKRHSTALDILYQTNMQIVYRANRSVLLRTDTQELQRYRLAPYSDSIHLSLHL